MSGLVLLFGFGLMASGALADDRTADRWAVVQLVGFVTVIAALCWSAPGDRLLRP